MGDSYWKYEQHQQQQQQQQQQLSVMGKRQRSDYDVSGMDLAVAAAAAAKARDTGLAGGRPGIALPRDASNTLFVEGLPSNCSRREVAHIFRPFVGYKEVRLVTKESRHSSGDPLVLCFVDFESPAEAATAKDALHGYKFDEHDRDSGILRMQFARNPGVRTCGSGRSGGRSRGRR
ncbi:RNA-binding protein 1-like protein [Tanacetum coccineum]